jgi:AAA domain
MSPTILITGTDTGIGKTVFAAGLCALLGASYWKPIQSGLEDETDSQLVARIAEIPTLRILPETYRLNAPLSPHRSAELDDVKIDSAGLTIPRVDGPPALICSLTCSPAGKYRPFCAPVPVSAPSITRCCRLRRCGHEISLCSALPSLAGRWRIRKRPLLKLARCAFWVDCRCWRRYYRAHFSPRCMLTLIRLSLSDSPT